MDHVDVGEGCSLLRPAQVAVTEPQLRTGASEIDTADRRESVDRAKEAAGPEIAPNRRECRLIDDPQPALGQTIGESGPTCLFTGEILWWYETVALAFGGAGEVLW